MAIQRWGLGSGFLSVYVRFELIGRLRRSFAVVDPSVWTNKKGMRTNVV